MTTDTDNIVLLRGEEPSVVEGFRIEGLYGYRTISLSSKYAATVLIAKNGSGKTTLLAALDAFLKGQFSRLRDINFARICCKLRGISEELVLTRGDVQAYMTSEPRGEFENQARLLEVDPEILLNFIEEFRDSDPTSIHPIENKIMSSIMRRVDYSRADAQVLIDRLRSLATANSPAIASILTSLKEVLSGTEIVYLPTYRRIELSIGSEKDQYGRPIKPLRTTRFGLQTGDIQFGLSDILARLSELNQHILLDSNEGYRQISASIINELIDGTFERGHPTLSEIPDKAELELFFTRLIEGRRMRPFLDVSLPNIDRIYSGTDISGETNKFLRYFLAKLGVVIGTTRDIEALVGDFIDRCNDYLSGQDQSTSPHGQRDGPHESNAEDKALKLNRKDLKIYVESIPAARIIPVDALSSGEKQMVSLFAKLFLYPKNKIVLIDEPELSLSLEWQRKILVDVVSAPLCKQVIAITHSPFIFDNALEPFARSLTSSIDDSFGENISTEGPRNDLRG